MRAPWFDRADLLYFAIRKATYTLQEPIDRVEVTGDRILFRAGTKELSIKYEYIAPGGPPMPGASPTLLLDGEECEN
jgi:hypothetical protein